jgi:hypothetical protein
MHIFANKMSKIFLFSVSLAMGLFAFSALASAPSVQTNSLASVSGSCAALRGYTNTNNTNGYSRWFEIKELNKNMQPIAVGQSWAWYGNGTGNVGYYQAEAKSLIPDTDYVYRAVAQNIDGITYGQEISFRTKTIEYVSNSFNGCSEYVPMTTNQNVVVNVDTGAVIPGNPGSLSLGSQNSNGYYPYGTQQSYQQSYNSIPLNQKISGISASNITDNSARLNVYTYPTQNVAQYGKFLWGKTPDLGNSTPRVALGSGATLILSQMIVGLNPGTKYYYKPIIDNQLGIVEGSLSSFTTTGSSSNSGIISDSSGYVAYNSTPVVGFTEKITTNPTSVTGASYQKIEQDTINAQSNIASVALAGNSHSIFPTTLSDWFTIISLLFICVLGYFSWVFYQQKKEEGLEYATVPAIFVGNETLVVPQKPTPTRRLGKDPFYKNDKTELIAEINANSANSVKSAPPDNLPI